MSGSQQDAAAESPSGLVARARSLLQERGAPLNAENLNRAMLIMRGGQDDGFTADIAETAASGGRRTASPAQAGSTGVTPPTSEDLPLPPPQPTQAQSAAPSAVGTSQQVAATQPPAVLPTVGASTADRVGQLSEMGLMLDPMGGLVAMPGGTTVATPGASMMATPSTGSPTSAAAATLPVDPATGATPPPDAPSARFAPSGQNARDYVFGSDGTDEVTGLPRSMVDTILGANRGMSMVRGPAAAGLPPGAVRPPGSPQPAIEMTNQVERMNVPTTMTPAPGMPPTALPNGPLPTIPGAGGPGVALPGARTPTMLEPPPTQPRMSGPPNRGRIQTDRGSPGRSQDTATQRSRAVSDELRSRNRNR